MYNPKTTSPFKSITISPSFGLNTANITWELDNVLINSKTYSLSIQKSKDGYTDWFDLEMTDPITGYETTVDDKLYIDSDLKHPNQSIEWHYKIILKNKVTGDTLTSNPTTYRHSLTPLEFGTISAILRNEFLSPDNIPMLLYRPLTNSSNPLATNKISQSINIMTGQVMGTAVDNVGFGKTYISGYSLPIVVYITIMQKNILTKDLSSGHGSVDNELVAMKSFAYPILHKGDLIIDAITDKRYLFDSIIKINEFNGLIPITVEGSMTQLSRNDIQYKFPIPDCAKEIIRNIRKSF